MEQEFVQLISKEGVSKKKKKKRFLTREKA